MVQVALAERSRLMLVILNLLPNWYLGEVLDLGIDEKSSQSRSHLGHVSSLRMKR